MQLCHEENAIDIFTHENPVRGADITHVSLFIYRTLGERIPEEHPLRTLVGLGMDEVVWNHSTFSANRDRLLNETVARSFFAKVLNLAESQGLASDERFKPATLGADKRYDIADFVATLRESKVTPHAAQKGKGSAIDGRTTRHAGYKTSLKIRKRIEKIFGWSKMVGGLRKARFVGLATVSAQTVFTFAVYNLTRMATLSGWRLSMV